MVLYKWLLCSLVWITYPYVWHIHINQLWSTVFVNESVLYIQIYYIVIDFIYVLFPIKIIFLYVLKCLDLDTVMW